MARRLWPLLLFSLPYAFCGLPRLPRSSPSRRRSWTLGVLGPTESASAFRIYFLPFVEPLDVDASLLDLSGALGPLAPLLLGALVFLVQQQINAVRREAEGKAFGSAAGAVRDAAAQKASEATQSLAERLQRVPAEQRPREELK